MANGITLPPNPTLEPRDIVNGKPGSPFRLPKDPSLLKSPGDGATPEPKPEPHEPIAVTNAITLLQHALGEHLPMRLAQAQQSAGRIRDAVGGG